mmetsp:Transcript_90073/g.169795  ORF Transcript_90073/g.169795 Transcript_90073/m.169795 type:complete len:205 (+) Transcript_90073:1279-1893(+)
MHLEQPVQAFGMESPTQEEDCFSPESFRPYGVVVPINHAELLLTLVCLIKLRSMMREYEVIAVSRYEECWRERAADMIHSFQQVDVKVSFRLDHAANHDKHSSRHPCRNFGITTGKLLGQCTQRDERTVQHQASNRWISVSVQQGGERAHRSSPEGDRRDASNGPQVVDACGQVISLKPAKRDVLSLRQSTPGKIKAEERNTKW